MVIFFDHNIGCLFVIPILTMHYLIIILTFASSALVHDADNSYVNYEICNIYNRRRFYLELGEHGRIEASNVTVPPFVNVIFI